MPIHEYCCHQCDCEFEEIVLSDGQSIVCPQCGSDRVEKFMSACKFRTGGPIVNGSPSANAVTSRGKSACSGCSGGNCSTC